jgi:hypothetical protein
MTVHFPDLVQALQWKQSALVKLMLWWKKNTTLSKQFKHLQCGIFLLDFGTVPTVWYFSIRFFNCSDSVVFFYYKNLIEKYHTVGTVLKSNRKTQNSALSEQLKNLIEKCHTVGTVQKSNKIFELYRQCGIFLLHFGTVPTVWYFSIRFLNCSDSVVFFFYIFELFWQCGIFQLDFWTVPTDSSKI